jgi:hypothetical protein
MRATDERRKVTSTPRSSTPSRHCWNAVRRRCGPRRRLLRQWEELPLTESVNLSVGVFGQSFLTDEPQRLMQGFLDRKRNP